MPSPTTKTLMVELLSLLDGGCIVNQQLLYTAGTEGAEPCEQRRLFVRFLDFIPQIFEFDFMVESTVDGCPRMYCTVPFDKYPNLPSLLEEYKVTFGTL